MKTSYISVIIQELSLIHILTHLKHAKSFCERDILLLVILATITSALCSARKTSALFLLMRFPVTL